MITANSREITMRLQELQRFLHRSVWAKTSADVSDLTIQQVRALHVVHDHPDLPMGELTEALGITKASVNALVNRLCHKGWLKRTTDRRDRRISRLSLTAPARKKIEAAILQKQTLIERAVTELSSSDREALQRILMLLSAHLHSSLSA